MKVMFVDGQDTSGHTATGQEIEQLFQIAERLSDSVLTKLERACQVSPTLPDDLRKKPYERGKEPVS